MTETLCTNEAFRPGSPWWGSLIGPAAIVVKGDSMDWRERLTEAGFRPAHGGGGGSMWLDLWERTISIDWQGQRFTYFCTEKERAPAFTPGKWYPLALLIEATKEELEPSVTLAKRTEVRQPAREPEAAASGKSKQRSLF